MNFSNTNQYLLCKTGVTRQYSRISLVYILEENKNDTTIVTVIVIDYISV